MLPGTHLSWKPTGFGLLLHGASVGTEPGETVHGWPESSLCVARSWRPCSRPGAAQSLAEGPQEDAEVKAWLGRSAASLSDLGAPLGSGTITRPTGAAADCLPGMLRNSRPVKRGPWYLLCGCCRKAQGPRALDRTQQDAAERDGTPPPELPLSPAPAGLLGRPAGIQGEAMRVARAQAPVHTARLELQAAPAQGHRGDARRRGLARHPQEKPPAALGLRGISANDPQSQPHGQQAAGLRRLRPLPAPSAPAPRLGVVTTQLTVQGTGGKVVETRQLAANEEN